MIPLPEALSLLDDRAHTLPTEHVRLAEALGRYLAQPLCAPFPLPPFSKSAMDGFAVRRADLDAGTVQLRILETVAAGALPTKPVITGTATQIMTGAPIPEGADWVVRVEYSELSGDQVRFTGTEKSSNIIERGENAPAGAEVLGARRRLRPSDIGVAASVGYGSVEAFVRPTIAILSTGDELCEPNGVPSRAADGADPATGTIFNSNSYQLYAHALRAGFAPEYFGIVPDNPEALAQTLEKAFENAQFVTLSGGVSKGNYDYVPDVLREFGVETVFHRVAMKPGRPTFFGVRERGAAARGSSTARGSNSSSDSNNAPGSSTPARRQYVFGLPGNPVSTFVTFELFARRLLERIVGIEPIWADRTVRLGETVRKGDPERTEFVPVAIEGNIATPVRYGGSSHLSALSSANALLMVPIGTTELEAGRQVDVRSI